MLTRLYIDNFRCFDNFEYRPARKQLVFGSNGAGKSSFVDALLLTWQISIAGVPLDDLSLQGQRTRWLNRTTQTIELEAQLGAGKYVYKIVLEAWGRPPRIRVLAETLQLNNDPIFSFQNGEVHLYNDRFEHKVTYPFDWLRSAFATIVPREDNQKLTQFKLWMSNIFCFRINPFAIGGRADGEHLFPNLQLDNLASWYRHLVQTDPRQNFALMESLQAVLDGFNFLQLEPAGENIRLLTAEFQSSGGSVKFLVHELSEGQRCLICLYTILHFVLSKGHTVIIDEPDNFISLREIQPWLTTVSNAVEERRGQIILISHHPEIIDQWAPANGVKFVRENGGPVRVQQFSPETAHGALTASELVARGWE